MSFAQIPTGTVVPSSTDNIPYIPKLVIPPKAIIKPKTVVPIPLQKEIDTRDPKNKKGLEGVPEGSVIPDGVYLPAGTCIPASVDIPEGSILPRHTIVPFGSKIPDKTSVPFGSLVVEGTEILLEDTQPTGVLSNLFYLVRKYVTDIGSSFLQIPSNTRIEKDTVFPIGSVIVPGTNLPRFEGGISIPLGTVIYSPAQLEKMDFDSFDNKDSRLELAKRKKGAQLPYRGVVITNANPEAVKNLVLPEGTVIPQFKNGDYAVIPPGTVIPRLADGSPSVIPENFQVVKQEVEKNSIAKFTTIPVGAKIPPGTVIPVGAVIPPDSILFLPLLDDGTPAYVPPFTHIPLVTDVDKNYITAKFHPSLIGVEMSVALGTKMFAASNTEIHVTPEVEVPENFKFPLSIVKNIRVVPGTMIPKTDMPINIPKGTIITSNTAWQLESPPPAAPPLSFVSRIANVTQKGGYLKMMLVYLHVILVLIAFSLATSLTQPEDSGFSRSFNVLFAVALPEVYLAVHAKDISRQFPLGNSLFTLAGLFVLFALMTVWAAYNL